MFGSIFQIKIMKALYSIKYLGGIFLPPLEARAEILKIISGFFGRFEDTKKHFEIN